jgi:hypothetical protein
MTVWQNLCNVNQINRYNTIVVLNRGKMAVPESDQACDIHIRTCSLIATVVKLALIMVIN